MAKYRKAAEAADCVALISLVAMGLILAPKNRFRNKNYAKYEI